MVMKCAHSILACRAKSSQISSAKNAENLTSLTKTFNLASLGLKLRLWGCFALSV